MSLEQNRSFLSPIFETIKENGRLFTIFSIAVIIISGFSIVENRDNWWFLIAGIAALFLIIFLYLNARIFIKVAVVLTLNIFIAAAAFQVGSFADQAGTGGLVWMSSTLFAFFTMLSVSYVISSGKGRWGAIGAGTFLGFIVSYIFAAGGLNVSLSAIIGVVVSIGVFLLAYKTGNKNKYKVSEMPTNLLTEELSKNIVKVFEENGWQATSLKSDKDDTGTVLTWDDRGYVLYPVYMDEEFTSIETKKKTMLGYKSVNINPWLLNLVQNKLPIWKSRNANLNLILLDMENANGTIPRVIGVNVADSKKPIPVGIIPAYSLSPTESNKPQTFVNNISETNQKNTNKNNSATKLSNRQKHKQEKDMYKINLDDPDDVITMIESEMTIYTQSLKPKQKTALSRIGKIEEEISKDRTGFRLGKKRVLDDKEKTHGLSTLNKEQNKSAKRYLDNFKTNDKVLQKRIKKAQNELNGK